MRSLVLCGAFGAVLSLSACGGDGPETKSASASSRAPIESSREVPQRRAQPDPVYVADRKVHDENKHDPRVVYSDALKASFLSKRQMLSECNKKAGEQRVACIQIANEVYQSTRADAKAQLEAALAASPELADSD